MQRPLRQEALWHSRWAQSEACVQAYEHTPFEHVPAIEPFVQPMPSVLRVQNPPQPSAAVCAHALAYEHEGVQPVTQAPRDALYVLPDAQVWQMPVSHAPVAG
jgi:hypothetical protein